MKYSSSPSGRLGGVLYHNRTLSVTLPYGVCIYFLFKLLIISQFVVWYTIQYMDVIIMKYFSHRYSKIHQFNN